MKKARIPVLSIAGFDPSGGAGILADAKVFEKHKVYGLGVISANTIQNDVSFQSIEWIPLTTMKQQLNILCDRYAIEYIKIGLIENTDTFIQLLAYLKTKIKEPKIIWDPILRASAGFEFHKTIDPNTLADICKELFLITPNVPEAIALGLDSDPHTNAKALSQYCHVFLKGGHALIKNGYDTLYLKEQKSFTFRPKSQVLFPKHGSGCVLSSALTANLALGENLHRSCLKAKRYVEKFLNSSASLNGYHS